MVSYNFSIFTVETPDMLMYVEMKHTPILILVSLQ
jgi:hypothetical protein